MSKTDWKTALKATNCRGNIAKIAREMRHLTYEELHDEDVAFEIAFERACAISNEPGDAHSYYMMVYMDYIAKTVKFEDKMIPKFCLSGGYSIGLSDEVISGVVRLVTKMADSTETEWNDKGWLIRVVEDTVRSCNMSSFTKELTRYFRTIQGALIKNIQAMRRLENARVQGRS